ncbi:hypothetical protein HPB47_006079 [Ixodes persulcatus]|uniref:Uncharacterized protein n=1 Tax=Ixodes persulcatus TaxID=34615 RepID=A0AC60PBJ7_IXOPE|nr:hypothetical protein HPB47_006079 [Ixodes persulcatus]
MEAVQAGVPDAANTALNITPEQRQRNERTRRNNSNSSSETIIQSKSIAEGFTVVFVPADTETSITSLSSVTLSRALENSCPEGIHERKKLGQIQAYSKSNSVGFHVAKPALECDKHFPEMESTRAGSNAAKEPTGHLLLKLRVLPPEQPRWCPQELPYPTRPVGQTP